MYRHEYTEGVLTKVLLVPKDWTCHAPQFRKTLSIDVGIDLLTGEDVYGPGAPCLRNREEDEEGLCCGCMKEGHWFEPKEEGKP